MKLSVIILGCWMSDYILAARANPQDSDLIMRNRLLYRRAPSDQGSPGRSSRPVARASAMVQIYDGNSPYRGTSFVKNENGKTTETGEAARYMSQFSNTKVSAGATQQENGRIRASATGKNVGVKLVVPEGSKGSYYTVGSTGGVRKTIDHTQSPFKISYPPDPQRMHTSAVVLLNGPGTAKAKAWN